MRTHYESCSGDGGGDSLAVRRWGGRAFAFTLIEVMLAITIFAGVVTAIYACWSSVVHGSRIGLSAAASAQRARVASHALEDALSTATMFQDNITNYAFYSELNGDFSALEFTAHLPESFPGFGIFDGLPVRRIRFSVEKATNGSSQLVMTQMPYLLTTTPPDQEPYAIVLAKDVSVFALHFWDTNANEWADEWTVYSNQVPRLIRYEMAFDDHGDKRAVPAITSGLVSPASVPVPPSALGQGGAGGGAGKPGGKPGAKPPPQPPQTPPAPGTINTGFGNTPGRNSAGFTSPYNRSAAGSGNNSFFNSPGQNQAGFTFGGGTGQNNQDISSGNNQAGLGGTVGRRSSITGGSTSPSQAGTGVTNRSSIGSPTSLPPSSGSGVSSQSSIVNSTNPPGVSK